MKKKKKVLHASECKTFVIIIHRCRESLKSDSLLMFTCNVFALVLICRFIMAVNRCHIFYLKRNEAVVYEEIKKKKKIPANLGYVDPALFKAEFLIGWKGFSLLHDSCVSAICVFIN